MPFKLLVATVFLLPAASRAQNPYTPPTCAAAFVESEPRTVAKYLEALSVQRGLLLPTHSENYRLGETEWTVHYVMLPEGHSLDPKKAEWATQILAERQLGDKWPGFSSWQLYGLSVGSAGAGIAFQLGAMWATWQVLLPYLNTLVQPLSRQTMTVNTVCAIGLAALAITSYSVMQSTLTATNFLTLRSHLPGFEPSLHLGVYNVEQRDRLHRFFNSARPRPRGP